MFLDAGSGSVGRSGAAAETDEPTALSTTIPGSSPWLLVRIEIEENQFAYSDSHNWPADIQAALNSDCEELIEIDVEIGGAVTAGQTEVDLALANRPCSD